MALVVNVVCRNLKEDRVLPRFSRYLGQCNGWSVTARADPHADLVYLSGYFEAQLLNPAPNVPIGAYFTHREEVPPGNGKAAYFDAMAKRLDLRVATCHKYARYLERFGPTVQIRPPVERDRFVIPTKRHRGIVVGFSGFTYSNKRKGEDLAARLVVDRKLRGVEWKASGRNWPVPTRRYSWGQMAAFYQSLDVLVVTSRVEGVPMPPLEALSCGVSVVIPRDVGLLDELPDVMGIHRYAKGDAGDLIRATREAVVARGDVEREELRAVTEEYTVQGWADAHREALEELVDGPSGGLEAPEEESEEPIQVTEIEEPEAESGGESKRGIYVVAFGDPARKCALRLLRSSKKHMPEIPICLCSDRKIGPEDILVTQPDSDIGGRRAKLKAYSLTPKDWTSILYLDADTEVVGDIRFYFELIEDGWEFVICKDPHLMDTMHSFRRANNQAELWETEEKVRTLHTLQWNGGVWAFGRNPRVRRFFARWLKEWERHAQRDQGALIRAMYTEPLKVYVLGNEWNTFTKYTKGIQTAGLRHHVGEARRWSGMIPGRIDSAVAWRRVAQWEQEQARPRRGGRRR